MARNFAHGGYVVQTTLPYKKKKKTIKALQHNEITNFRHLNEKIISDSVENSHHFLNPSGVRSKLTILTKVFRDLLRPCTYFRFEICDPLWV